MSITTNSVATKALQERRKRRVLSRPDLYPTHIVNASKQQQKQLLADSSDKALNGLIQKVTNQPFWRWDLTVEEHKQLYQAKLCNCFNCVIGWPVKNGVELPLFDYQKLILDTLERHRRLYLLKAGGIGASELLLRYMSYLALARATEFRNSQMVILTGPRIDLSVSLVRRMKGLFEPLGILFDDKETVLNLPNNIRIESFPSQYAIQAARGLPNVSFILADEAAWFSPAHEALAIIDRYIIKDDAMCAVVSTPWKTGDLMHIIHNQHNDACHFKRLYLDYTVATGNGKLYSQHEIEQLRKTSISFEREMNLSWNIGIPGNLFSTISINRAIERGLEAYGAQYHPSGAHILSVDPAFGSGVSNTAVTVLQILQTPTSQLQIVYSQEFESPDFNFLTHKIVSLTAEYKPINNVYCDAAFPALITSLKKLLHDWPADNYLEHIANMEKQYKDIPVERWVKVIPVAFNSKRYDMLAKLHMVLDDSRGILAISSKFDRLLAALRSAQVDSNRNLLKDEAVFSDSLDSLLMCMNAVNYKPQMR